MTRSKLVVVLVAFALTVTVVASPVGAQRGDRTDDGPPTFSPEVEALAAQAGDDGTVSVIVGLDTPTTPEGQLSDAAAAEQRARIADSRDDLLVDLGAISATVTQTYETLPFVVVEVDQAGLDALAGSDAVSGIFHNTPDSAYLKESIPKINADDAWAAGYDGDGKAIAILDTGTDKTHPMLDAGKVVSEACYSLLFDCPGDVQAKTGAGAGVPCTYSTSCEHGTHVAGIAAGFNGNAGAGRIDGVAREADVIAINVFSNTAPGGAGSYPSDQIKGLERVYQLRNTYDIASVNMSLGGSQYFSYCDAVEGPRKAAIDMLRSAGIATVIATGNDGFTTSMGTPACISTAVSVGSTTDADAISSFSNQAFWASLSAPGSSITSAIPGGGYGNWNGTSMATPHVAGAFAILDEKAGRDTVGRKLALLAETGLLITDITGLKFPRIDVKAALDQMPPTPPNPGFSDVPSNHLFYVDIAWAVAQNIVAGFNNNTFRPNGTLTRDAMVAYLYRLAGSPAGPFPNPGFSDVPSNHTFFKEISWAKATGVTSGNANGTFGPSDPVSRAVMAAFLWKQQGQPTSPIPNPGTLPNPGFSDVGNSHIFKSAIFWAAYYEVTRGYANGTFAPSQDMKRQEAVAFLYRYAPLLIRAD